MCPRCHSAQVSRSRTPAIRDGLMRWLGMCAYRCRECNKRFYVPAKIDRNLRRERAWRESVEAARDASAAAPKATVRTADPRP